VIAQGVTSTWERCGLNGIALKLRRAEERFIPTIYARRQLKRLLGGPLTWEEDPGNLPHRAADNVELDRLVWPNEW